MIKVWIYQSNRRLSSQEEAGIKGEVNNFLNDWQTHGKPMAAEFEIRHHLFLILKVDEDYQAPSGCAIDKSVALFKYIVQSYDIELFDRHQFAYEYQGQVINDRLTNLNQLVQQGYITDETMVYNNLVSSLPELESQFRIPFKDSWHRNMVSKSAFTA